MSDEPEDETDRALRRQRRDVERRVSQTGNPGAQVLLLTKNDGEFNEEWKALQRAHDEGGDWKVFPFFYDVQMLRDAALFSTSLDKEEYNTLGFHRKLKEFELRGAVHIEMAKTALGHRNFSNLIRLVEVALSKQQSLGRGSGMAL